MSTVHPSLSARRPEPLPSGVDAEVRLRSGIYPAAKRVLDVTVTSILLLLVAPVWIAIALAVRLDSPGPVLFRQERLGKSGRRFVLLKFRSMWANADERLHREYVSTLITAGAPSEIADGRPVFKVRRDPRVTRVGRLLRKMSLDELPQLVNVLRGEMSLVGPRPPLAYEVEQYEPWQLKRLEAVPGLTGLWQVYGRSRVSFEEMVRMDIAYIEQASLWLDLKLLALTVPAVVIGAGAD